MFPESTTPAEMGYNNSAVNIQFEHIATGVKVEFFAWITNFSDAYKSDWNSQTLYGRMDPMMTFKNTSRKITLDWDVVASSLDEAKVNMSKMSRFIKFHYPTYASSGGSRGGGGASMIGSPPLMRVKFMNWIGSALDGKGLICALAGVTFKPNMEHGVFADSNKLYPQSFAISVEMTALHEHDLGFSDAFPTVGAPRGTFGITKAPDSSTYKVHNEFPHGVPPLGRLRREAAEAAKLKKDQEAPNDAISAPTNAAADEGAVTGGDGSSEPDPAP